jgi:anti-anti-sigma regulatory factor
MSITLEGRIAGPWADELSRVWEERVPQESPTRVLIDLCEVTYADASGKQVLSHIYNQTGAKLITGNPWTEYLAGEIRAGSANCVDKEVVNANHT